MKKLKTLSLILAVMGGSFFSAYATTPDEVNCDTPSRMFGESLCIDADGNVKICRHTFWITHSCNNYYGDAIIEDNPQ